MEELFGLEDGVALAFDLAELLDAVLKYFDFLYIDGQKFWIQNQSVNN